MIKRKPPQPRRKYTITWQEVSSYTADIETDLSEEELRELGESTWFKLIDKQDPDWPNCVEVSERQLVSIREQKTKQGKG